MISKTKILALVLGLQGVLAWAQSPSLYIQAQSASTRVEVLGSPYGGKHPVHAQQSRIVIYSLPDAGLPGATSIFVNGTYHASLVKDAYSDLCFTPGPVELGTRQAEFGTRPKDPPDSVLATSLNAGQTHYWRVGEQQGRPMLQAVEPAQAEQELPGRRLQVHTISRVAQACLQADTGTTSSRLPQ